MCDTFVALGSATVDGSVLLAKNADTEVNEAQHLVRFPARDYGEGAMVRLSHITIPQARRTHEVILNKSFWTWGAEIGFNEHGVAVGNEAVYSNQAPDRDGVMIIDLLRLVLERAHDCEEATRVVAWAIETFGQGGNCELRGNSHFDGSLLVADREGAVVIETAGREWAARRVGDLGSISNVIRIRDDWHRSSLEKAEGAGGDFRERFADVATSANTAAEDRQRESEGFLEARRGRIDVRAMMDLIRYTGEDPDYHPAEGDRPCHVCMYAGPHPNRLWQATGSMVSQCRGGAVIGWMTGASGPEMSIFKPLFPGVELPDLGPMPRETWTEDAYWWRHEHLHRRAMADYRRVVPEIRAEFEAIEDGFLAEAATVLAADRATKAAFVRDCWARAFEAEERWTKKLAGRPYHIDHPGYREMWEGFNRTAALTLD
jgi:secernin